MDWRVDGRETRGCDATQRAVKRTTTTLHRGCNEGGETGAGSGWSVGIAQLVSR